MAENKTGRQTDSTIRYPLYLAGFATSICGLAALNASVSDWAFFVIAAVALACGYLISIAIRRVGKTTRLIELGVVAGAIIIYIQIAAGIDIVQYLLPVSTLTTPELKLASMLLWLEVLRSFTLVSDEAVIFSGIPAIVMISLSSTANVNPEMLAYFVVYLLIATFMLACRPGKANRKYDTAFRSAVITATSAILIGGILVVPVRLLCVRAFEFAMPGFRQIGENAHLYIIGDGGFLQIAQGPVRLSNRIVMSVKIGSHPNTGPVDLYWRGRVFDEYTGHGWEETSNYVTKTADAWKIDQNGKQVWIFGKQKVDPERKLEQLFDLGPIPGGVMYAAAEPAIIAAPTPTLRRNSLNCWQGVWGRHSWNQYIVVSELPIVAPKQLRNAGENYPSEIIDRYTQTLITTEQVGIVARRITEGLKTPYDRVRAIEQYIGENYKYDLNAPPAPPNTDAVSYFLFTSKRGYCDVFASAMVIMCREIGIPARLATGFTTGLYDPSQDRYLVREMDKHAWAEVYFPGYGWVSFDPTTWTIEEPETWYEQLSRKLHRLTGGLIGGGTTLPVLIFALLICAITAFVPELRRAVKAEKPNAPSRLHAAAAVRYTAIRKTLKAHEAYLTPFEIAKKAEAFSNEAFTTAYSAALLYSKIRYSPEDATKENLRELVLLHKKLKSEIRRKPKKT